MSRSLKTLVSGRDIVGNQPMHRLHNVIPGSFMSCLVGQVNFCAPFIYSVRIFSAFHGALSSEDPRPSSEIVI